MRRVVSLSERSTSLSLHKLNLLNWVWKNSNTFILIVEFICNDPCKNKLYEFNQNESLINCIGIEMSNVKITIFGSHFHVLINNWLLIDILQIWKSQEKFGCIRNFVSFQIFWSTLELHFVMLCQKKKKKGPHTC